MKLLSSTFLLGNNHVATSAACNRVQVVVLPLGTDRTYTASFSSRDLDRSLGTAEFLTRILGTEPSEDELLTFESHLTAHL